MEKFKDKIAEDLKHLKSSDEYNMLDDGHKEELNIFEDILMKILSGQFELDSLREELSDYEFEVFTKLLKIFSNVTQISDKDSIEGAKRIITEYDLSDSPSLDKTITEIAVKDMLDNEEYERLQTLKEIKKI